MKIRRKTAGQGVDAVTTSRLFGRGPKSIHIRPQSVRAVINRVSIAPERRNYSVTASYPQARAWYNNNNSFKREFYD